MAKFLSVAACIALSTAAPLEQEGVHPERLAQIKEINSVEGITWTAAPHPRFAAFAPGVSKPLMGVNGDWTADIQKGIESGEIVQHFASPDEVIPASFDSATNWPKCAKSISDIRDQSNCGCCWAFAGAEVASDRMCIATGGKMLMPLAAEDVCFCASFNGCGGGQISTPFRHIQTEGVVTGGNFNGTGAFGEGYCSDFSLPHCHHHGPVRNDPYPSEGSPGCPSQSSPRCPKTCDAKAVAPHNEFKDDKYTYKGGMASASGEQDIMSLIMAGGPVETAFTVYSDFENYASGIYTHTQGSVLGGHAVKFVGWGEENGKKYWKVANSWNPYWGEDGYFRIEKGTNNCGIENGVTASSNSATWSKKSLISAF